MRIFVGLEIAQAQARGIESFVREVTPILTEARHIRRQDWHITLKFLGETLGQAPGRLVDALSICAGAAAQTGVFEASLATAGAFPTAGRATIVWVGTQDPTGAMSALAARLEQASSDLGFVVEHRAFEPHLTIARLKAPVRIEPSELERACEGLDRRRFRVGHLALFASRRSKSGSRYEVVQRFCFSRS